MATAENNKEDEFLSEQVSGKEKRKLKTQGTNSGSAWSGLGMFGMVGWSVAVPTLLGTALGLWLDKRHPITFSWTLSCLVIGLFSGCVIAWYWISKNNNDEQ